MVLVGTPEVVVRLRWISRPMVLTTMVAESRPKVKLTSSTFLPEPSGLWTVKTPASVAAATKTILPAMTVEAWYMLPRSAAS